MADERTLTVSFVAKTGQFNQGINSARTHVRSFRQSMRDITVGMRGLTGVFLPVAGVGGALYMTGLQLRRAAEAAIAFESAFASVRKTVDASESQFASMRKELVDLSVATGESATDLMETAAAAGQSGIRTENIVEFTKVMSEMAVASNLTSEAAAIGFAKWATITNLAQEEIDSLADAVVHLGNNTAAFEDEIVEMGLRLGAAGKIIGMTDAQIVGLAASLTSVGIEAEMGGTAMSKIMKDIANSVDTGNEQLRLFARLAGMSTEEFQQAFRQDGIQAILRVIEGFKAFTDAGGPAFLLMEKLGIDAERMGDTFLRLAHSVNSVNGNMAMATQAFLESTARTVEAEKRYQTTEYQVKQLGASFQALRAELASEFMPMFNNLVGGTKELTEWLRVLNTRLTDFGGLVGSVLRPLVLLGKVVAGLFINNLAIAANGLNGIAYNFTRTVGTILKTLAMLVPGFSTTFGKLGDDITAFGEDVFRGRNNPLAEFADAMLAERDKWFGSAGGSLQALGESLMQAIFGDSDNRNAEDAGKKKGKAFIESVADEILDFIQGGGDAGMVTDITKLMNAERDQEFGKSFIEGVIDLFKTKDKSADAIIPKLERERRLQGDITEQMEEQAKLSKDFGEGIGMRSAEFTQRTGSVTGGPVQGIGRTATGGLQRTGAGGMFGGGVNLDALAQRLGISPERQSYLDSWAKRKARESVFGQRRGDAFSTSVGESAVRESNARSGPDAAIPLLQGILDATRNIQANTARNMTPVLG